MSWFNIMVYDMDHCYGSCCCLCHGKMLCGLMSWFILWFMSWFISWFNVMVDVLVQCHVLCCGLLSLFYIMHFNVMVQCHGLCCGSCHSLNPWFNVLVYVMV